MMTSRCERESPIPLSFTNLAIRSGTNLPAAHAVSTDKPSASTTPR